MWPKSLSIFGLVATAGIASFTAMGGGTPTTQPQTPVSLQDVRDRGIEGHLGFRLGTIIEVTGEVIENTSRRKADADEPFILSITSVNGKSLVQPVLYPFVKQNMAIAIAPRIGDKFHFVGYETGGFEGSPEGEFQYILAYSTTGYHFATRFVVLAAK